MPPLMFFCGLGLVWRLTMSRALDQDPAPHAGQDLQAHAAMLGQIPVLARDHDHRVFFLDMHFCLLCLSAIRSSSGLQNLRGQGDDLHELLVPQLTRHRPEDASADRLPASLINTAAFWSKRMYEPSRRRWAA